MERSKMKLTNISVKKCQPVQVPAQTESDSEFYFLNNIDQEFALMLKLLYIYKPKEGRSNKNVCTVMKEALAKVLVHFYPLAGSLRVDDDGKFIIRCTNEGATFVEAEADCDIDELGDITIPNPVLLDQLLHTISGTSDIRQMPLLSLQVTMFKCGGFALGITANHLVADGKATSNFINSWAEIARGVPLTTAPFLDRRVFAARKPPIIQYQHDTYTKLSDVSNMSSLFINETTVNEAFYFDSEKISRLKSRATEDGVIKSCTSFTALAALLWSLRTKALKLRPDQKTRLLFMVDVRSRLDTPLPKGYFGNGIMLASCVCTAGKLKEMPLSFVVKMVQEAVDRMNEDFIRSAIDFMEVNKPKNDFTATLLLSSWTRLNFNMADFGCGEPVYTACAEPLEKDMALFLPGRKDGHEKGVTLLFGLPASSMKIFNALMLSV